MSNGARHRSLVFVLAGALGVALLVIAFLLGRESSRDAEHREPDPLPASATVEPNAAGDTPAQNAERPWPEWADLEEWDPNATESPVTQTYEGRIEQHPDGRVLLSNRNFDGSSQSPMPSGTPQPTADPSTAGTNASDPASVDAYFQRVDAIRSSSSATDPNAFAREVLSATMKGSTDAFDQLVEDTQRMRDEMASLDPPAACLAYHHESIKALDDSRAILETMKTAIQSGNIGMLTQVTRQAGLLQSRAETLEALRRQALATAR